MLWFWVGLIFTQLGRHMALYQLLEKVTLVRRSGNTYRPYFSRLFENSSKSTAPVP